MPIHVPPIVRTRRGLNGARKLALLALFVPACAMAFGGCTRARAKTIPESPPLEMPPPPPRDVEPTEPETPQPMPLPQEPARSAPPRTRPAPTTPPRTEAPKPEPPKVETPVIEAPKPEEAPRTPPPTLQTTPPNAEGEMERLIYVAIARATNDLNHIDYRALNSDGRVQYDQAKGLIRQADDAMKKKNLVFAKTLADKAAAVAAQLGGK